MQKLNLVNNGIFKLEDCPTPDIDTSQCLIKVNFCGVCSTDIYRSHSNEAYFYPLVMGHEISGTIQKVGENVTNLFPGDKVGVFPLIPCFSCNACSKGDYMLCHDYSYHGSRCSGGYADFMAVNAWNLVKIPDKIDIKDAAFLEPAAVVLHALQKCHLWDQEQKKILIIGAGFLGLLLTNVLLLRSTKHQIYVMDRNEFKFKELPNQVKTATSLEQIEAESFDVVFEGTGSNAGVQSAIDKVERGGKICLLGNPTGSINLEKNYFSNILRKEINIFGSWNSTFRHEIGDDWSMVIKLMEHGLSPSKFVSHQLALADVPNFLKNCWDHKTGTKLFQHVKGIVKL